MKKQFLVIGAIVAVVLFLSSCRSHERCPAYGKIDKEKTERSV